MHSLNSLMTSQVALWCTFLSTRGVFSTFKTFKDFVEKQSSLSIKKLSTDNGGSMSIKNSRIFVENKEFNISTLFPKPIS
jgi:hypothetical protein